MSESKFEIGDRLFTKGGFWRRIAPIIAGNGLGAFALTAAAANRVDATFWQALFAALGFGGLVCIFNLYRYWGATERHNDLKLRFAEQYRALVDEGKVDLTPIAVLYAGQPKGVRWKHFNEGNPWD